MPAFVEGFVVSDIAEVHELYLRLIKVAEEAAAVERREVGFDLAASARLTLIKRSYSQFKKRLDRVASRGAADAITEMRKAFDQTAIRATSTGAAPGLRAVLNARPIALSLPSGTVGIGDMDLLSRAVNPRTPGYGTYWRAQEYGTGNDGVPSQVGRVIRGYFDGTDPPDAQFRGGGGPARFFLPGSESGGHGGAGSGEGPQGGRGGYGTISVEDPARHFIRDGAAAAGVEWRASLAKLQVQAIDEISQIVDETTP